MHADESRPWRPSMIQDCLGPVVRRVSVLSFVNGSVVVGVVDVCDVGDVIAWTSRC